MAGCRHLKRNGVFYAWAAKMREAGFEDYFAKPISLKNIFEAVKESFIKLNS